MNTHPTIHKFTTLEASQLVLQSQKLRESRPTQEVTISIQGHCRRGVEEYQTSTARIHAGNAESATVGECHRFLTWETINNDNDYTLQRLSLSWPQITKDFEVDWFLVTQMAHYIGEALDVPNGTAAVKYYWYKMNEYNTL